MRRREFIGLIGGTAAWPLAARAQPSDQMRRLGVLMGFSESDPEWQANLAAFRAALQELGWTDRRNVRIDVRWTAGDPDVTRAAATELEGLAPNVILAYPHSAAAVMHQQTKTIPIVAIQSGDLVDAGFTQSLARPSGNVTGFSLFGPGLSAKFLQLLKEIAPQLTRVAVMQSENSTWRGDFGAVGSVAQSFAVEPIAAIVRDAADIERAMAGLAGEPNSGLIVPPDGRTERHRELIISLAAKYRLPSVYAARAFVTGGGLMFYGTDYVEIFRRAASYIDRILRGAKPGELPVQAPTKFQLIINLKTAKSLGLIVPLSLIGRADEVIE